MSQLSRQKSKMTHDVYDRVYRTLTASHFPDKLWIDAGRHEQASAKLRLTPDEVLFVRNECDAFLEAVTAVTPKPVGGAELVVGVVS